MRSEWFEAISFPIAAAQDPRTKPRELSTLLAVRSLATKSNEASWWSDHPFGSRERGTPIPMRQIHHRLRVADPVVLRRILHDLQQWHYCLVRHRPGEMSRFDLLTEQDVHFHDWGRFAWIPETVVVDARLNAGDVAAYIALAAAAELEVQEKWGPWEVAEERPMYGVHCTISARDLDILAGYSHSTQRHRHLDRLVATRHIRLRTRPKGQRKGDFDLLTSGAANVALPMGV